MSAWTVPQAVEPAALLEVVLSQSADGVVEQGVDGSIRWWNPAAARMLGLAGHLAAGRAFGELVDAVDVDAWDRLLRDVVAGGEGTLRLQLRRTDGLPVPVSLSAAALRDDAGVVTGCALVIHDQTESRLAQETLALAEERVRRTERLAGAGSFVIDAADPQSPWTEQWSEGMFGVFDTSPDDFDGTWAGHLLMVHPEDRAVVSAAIESVIGAGRVVELDHRVILDGRAAWVALTAEPVADSAGERTGARGVCQDITARKDAEQSVLSSLDVARRAYDELRAVDRLKDEFLATVSHELRTPLTSISGFAGLLLKSAPQLSTYIVPIARSGDEMIRMVEKLLDYTRLHAGHVALEPEPLGLADEVDTCVAPLAARSPEQTFCNDVPADLQVVTDRHALERVLGNLIGNASRYAHATSTIRVSARLEDNGDTLLGVSDDGPGIPAEHQERLFERFYQVPGTSRRRGTGIGLAIVREYVTQQGGAVWCESSDGAGTTFWVQLPAASEVNP